MNIISKNNMVCNTSRGPSSIYATSTRIVEYTSFVVYSVLIESGKTIVLQTFDDHHCMLIV